MTLLEVVDRLDELNETGDRLTIYVVAPWQLASEAIVVDQPEDGDTSVTFKTASGADASYFLEVLGAKDFLRAWRADVYGSSLAGLRATSREEGCRRLIRYALYDA